MSEREDLDMLAAEYVLGTLDEGERAQVAARRLREPELDGAIEEWGMRLSPMLEKIAEASPRTDLLELIEEQIGQKTDEDFSFQSNATISQALHRRLALWRGAAIAASAIAAGLAGFIVYSEAYLPFAYQNFVAVFQEGDQQPQFLLSVNLKTRELMIRPIAARQQADKSYQLWIVADELGPGPQSLGLLDDPGAPTKKQLRQFDQNLLRDATFGISLEPEGGSPTGKPTGPALHGKLLPTSL